MDAGPKNLDRDENAQDEIDKLNRTHGDLAYQIGMIFSSTHFV
jgi:hypothetical protein